MPRRSKGPRLYLDTRRGQWVIRDSTKYLRTGCGEGDSAGAEKALSRYIASKHKPASGPDPLIADVLNVYAQEVAPYRKTAANLGYVVGYLLDYWGLMHVSEVNPKACREYARAVKTSIAWANLKILQAAINYWHAEHRPLSSVPSIWLPPGPSPRDIFLTKSQAAALLRASRRTLHVKRFILLGLHTGSRPGTLLALTWDQINFERGVLTRLKRGEAQSENKRKPPAKLGWKILAHLKRWRRLDAPTAGTSYICHYNGTQVKSVRRAFTHAVKLAGIADKVTPHTLRHTRATWLMEKGTPTWSAAGHLGMTVATLERVYGKHHPDFQDDAANI